MALFHMYIVTDYPYVHVSCRDLYMCISHRDFSLFPRDFSCRLVVDCITDDDGGFNQFRLLDILKINHQVH